MARHLSVEKRHRQSLVRNRRNRAVKSVIRGAVKQVETATEAEAKTAALNNLASIADKSAAKKVIHKNKASRMKSRMTKRLNKSPEEADKQ